MADFTTGTGGLYGNALDRVNQANAQALRRDVGGAVTASGIISHDGTTPITPSSLTPASPLDLPATTPSTTAAGLSGRADAIIQKDSADKAIEAKTALDTTNAGNEQSTWDKLTGKLTSIYGSRDQLEQDAGVSDLKKLKDDTLSEIERTKQAQENEIRALKENPTGMSTAALAGETDRITSKYANKQADLAINYDIYNRNYTSAMETIDKKIQNQLDPVEKLMSYQSQFLGNAKNILNDDQKTQLSKLIDDNKTKIANKKAVGDLITEGLKTNPTAFTPEVIKDLTDNATDNLSASQILAKHGVSLQDPVDVAYKKAQTSKLIADAKSTGSPTVGIVNDKGVTVSIPTNVAPYYNTSNSGVGYIDASTLQGTATEKTKIINDAQAAGLKVITNKNTAADLVNIKDANSKLDTISTALVGIAQPGWATRALYGLGLTKLAQATESDPQKAAAGVLESVGLDILKGISGVQGFRGNQTAIQKITDHLPKVTDTVDVVNQKIDFIRKLLSDREDAAVGKASDSSTNTGQVVNGVTYSRGADGLYYPKK